MKQRRVYWADLPPELLVSIVDRLDVQTHILQFRGVCKAWRRSAALSCLSGKHLLSPILPFKLSISANDLLYREENLKMCVPGSRLILVATSVFLLKSALNPNNPPWLLTVEELNLGKLYLRRPLSRLTTEKLPENLPRILSLSQFQVSELGRCYMLRVDDNLGDMSKIRTPFDHKVVLCVDPKSAISGKIDDYSAIVMYADGVLVFLRIKYEFCHRVEGPSGTQKFDDIVDFKGRIYAVDRKGKAYVLQYGLGLLKPVVNVALGTCNYLYRRKRLVVWGNELYLVYRSHFNSKPIDFKVFKLNGKDKIWDEVEGIGDDKMLFATYDSCFFASVNDFPGLKGNCIVFYRGSFSAFTGGTDSEFEISVFHFDGRHCGSIKSYPAYSDIFCSPPSWFSAAACLPKGVPSEDQDQQRENGNQSISEPIPDAEISPTLPAGEDVQAAQNKITGLSNTYSRKPTNSSGQVGQLHVRSDPVPQFRQPVTTAVDSPPIVDLTEVADKFEGVDVSSNLIPVLQKIWKKHGDVIQGHVVQSNALLRWALESLAKMVIILQCDSGRSLSNSQAEYLKSTLKDLRTLKFRVEWLVPFVKRALAFHKHKESIHTTKLELESKKSELIPKLHGVQEKLLILESEKSELVAELQDIEKRLLEQDKVLARLSSRLSDVGEMV